MASRNAIIDCFQLLRLAGVKGGPDALDREGNDALIGIWQALLADLDDRQLHAATAAILRDPAVCQWWPQPGIVLAHVPGRQAEQVDDADEAWGVVLRAVGSVGWYGTPRWDDDERGRAIASAVGACGGWRNLCEMKVNDAAMRACFRSAYRTYVQRGRLARDEEVIAGLLGGNVLARIGVDDA